MNGNSPPITIRIPPLLLAAIDAEIAERNAAGPMEPWTRSRFLLVAADCDLAASMKDREIARQKKTKAKKPASKATKPRKK